MVLLLGLDLKKEGFFNSEVEVVDIRKKDDMKAWNIDSARVG